MENVFKNFNKKFWKSVTNITWFDKQGIMEFDQNRLILITIDDIGTRDSFNGYWVEILNKTSGTIAKKFFRFSEHLTMIKNGHDYCHAWYNRGEIDWYISKPVNTKEMTDIIVNWINKFK